ncbi:MAG: serine/threonine protein kinase [Candidatus Obscuribacterales bacterium]|jgi:serine/threonine protein kinase|nr:serine/threonine protein kinase [Candidatus Obscuribacterales bacterium]
MSHETDVTTSDQDVDLVSKAEKQAENQAENQAGLSSATDLEAVFELQSEVARGGMGIIYKCFHKKLQRVCALKIMQDIGQDDIALKRFMQEARLVCSFDHPNIVKIFSVGFDKIQRPYFAMEWLEGSSLDSLMNRKERMSFRDYKEIFEQALNALSYAHNRNIVHRDIKPSNIFVIRDDRGRPSVKLLDFGIARTLEETPSTSTKLTRTGSLLGSPRYMSPEQCNSKAADRRTDIYAIAVVMYEALAGTHLFDGDNPMEIMYKQSMEVPDASRLPKDPRMQPLNQCILKSLAKDPDDRYQSIDEFLAALKQSWSELDDEELQHSQNGIDHASTKARLRKLFVVTGVALAVLIGSLFALNKRTPKSVAPNSIAIKNLNSLSPSASCKNLRLRANDAVSQIYLAKKQQDWAKAAEYTKLAEKLLRRSIEVGVAKIAELSRHSRLSKMQNDEYILNANEVHNAGQALGELLFEQGRLDEALSGYEIGVKYAYQNFALSTFSVCRQSVVLHYQGRMNDALTLLAKQEKWADKQIAESKNSSGAVGQRHLGFEFWQRLTEIRDSIGDCYVSLGLMDKALDAYRKAEKSAGMYREIESDSVSMIVRGKIASINQQLWPVVYKEAVEKKDAKSYRSAEVIRLYAWCIEDTDPARARSLFGESLDTFKNSTERADAIDADCVGRVVQSYAEFEIDNQLKSMGADEHKTLSPDPDFKKALDIAARGEKYWSTECFYPRLRAIVNYVRGAVFYLRKDYDQAVKLFELVELDVGRDPYSVAHLAKLLRANSLLKKGMNFEADQQFLQLDPTLIPFAQCIQTGPSYLTEPLQNCASAFEHAKKDKLAKLIRTKIEASGRLESPSGSPNRSRTVAQDSSR